MAAGDDGRDASALLARRGGMRRAGAAVLIILYFAFVAGTLVG